MNKPELVCPAGDWSSLATVVENGADSVYFGVKGVNMRNLAMNFDILEIKKIMNFVHGHKKKGYLALNVVIMDEQLDKAEQILKEAKSAGVDAVIAADMAVFSLAKELDLPVHLSTQLSIANMKAVSFFADLGARRVILARECSLGQIRQMIQLIKKKEIRCEIETFIHGAMCISISGRCFLSLYSLGKSANQGECLQPCRREFFIQDKTEQLKYILGENYVLSSKDLCSIDFIDELITAGINAFKIEGRKRSPEYLKVVVSVYRKAIDSFCEGKLSQDLKGFLKEQLTKVFNRGFCTGFYFGQPLDANSKGTEHSYEKVFLGEVVKFYKNIQVAQVAIQNEFLNKGDYLLFMGKKTPACFSRAVELQRNHLFVEKVGKGDSVGIKLPFLVKPKDKVFLWKEKIY